MAKIKPEIGQYIEHRILGGQHPERGIVTSYLSAQFCYITASGSFRIALFSEEWKTMGRRAERQQKTVTAPSVWRDHESRTCIVLEADDELVKYIPLTVDVPFDVQECCNQSFRTQVYLEPIDYPVERAARLYVEYACNTGATEEALKALSNHTAITKEEKTMAKNRAAAATEDEPPKKTAAKKTAAKKTVAKKTVSKKTAAATTDKKPRVSAAYVYRDQIAAGKSAKQVLAAVNKKFPGKGRIDYVKWYWKEVCKTKEVPEPKGLTAAIKAAKNG